MNKKYTLKQDVLWYKKGETFWFDERGMLYHDDHINPPIATLDRLQNAIASHFDDEDAGEYFESAGVGAASTLPPKKSKESK